MAIYAPGKRDRRGHRTSKKRSVVAVLSLTAMVDLFTVLVVFLLQNYATTGEVIEIPENVELPQAKAVKDLQPANIVIVSDKGIQLNNEVVASFDTVVAQRERSIVPLRDKRIRIIYDGEENKSKLTAKLRSAVDTLGKEEGEEYDQFRRLTLQADKEVDCLTLKKIMYTATEAGIYQMNFAVLKSTDDNEI